VTVTTQNDKLLAGAAPLVALDRVCPPARPGPLFVCSKCGQEKPSDEFWRFRKDGTPSGRCRACQSAENVISQQRHGYATGYAAVKRWRHNHPIEARHQDTDNKRVQRGTLPAGPCEVCGRHVSQNHHEAYDGRKPRRLCRRCHNAAHGKRSYQESAQ